LPPLKEYDEEREIIRGSIKKIPPKKERDDKKVLFLDIDETLVYCSTDPIDSYDLAFEIVFKGELQSIYVKKRPFLDEFLDTISKNFYCIVYSSAQSVYLEKLISEIDKEGRIKNFYERTNCIRVNGFYIKDLSIFETPDCKLKEMMILDDSIQAFAYQLNNGIPILKFDSKSEDNELKNILPFLLKLSDPSVEDVRNLISEKFNLSNKVKGEQENKSTLATSPMDAVNNFFFYFRIYPFNFYFSS
jgi:CTD small phosphatase-like protein 2